MAALHLPASITAQALHALLLASQELALLDVREARAHVAGHPNLARFAPLSSLALEVRDLVPRLDTPVVLLDGGERDGPASRAARLLLRVGYSDVRLLAGGTVAWNAAGLPLIDGYATLIKAFGAQVLARHAPPTLNGEMLRAQRMTDTAPTLIDARPADEHAYLSLPGAHNHPGTELALRQWPANGRSGTWVVHCFSRTRGIIGSTTLRLLGHPDARFLEDGVMQWALDGAPVRQDAQPPFDLPVAADAELQDRADQLIRSHELPLLDVDALLHLQAEADRTLHVFDLRPGAVVDPCTGVRSVAGGQLLMHFESLVGTRGARVVLLDDPHRLRAAVTAFWLVQFGQAEVFILNGELPPAWRARRDEDCDLAAGAGDGLSPGELAALLDADPPGERLRVVDVGPSADYERGHLPHADFLLPFTLEPLSALQSDALRIVFSSPDGRAARWVAAEARDRWPAARFDWLHGGTAAWRAAGLPVEQTWEPSQLLTAFEDDWGSVMRVTPRQRDRVWADYLAWERGLSERVMRDPTVRFRLF